MQKINELQLAKELMKFPSITPRDAGVMRFLEKKLKKIGFKTKILNFEEKNFKPVKNLYARAYKFFTGLKFFSSKFKILVLKPIFFSFFSKNLITPASLGVIDGNFISSLANCNSFIFCIISLLKDR